MVSLGSPERLASSHELTGTSGTNSLIHCAISSMPGSSEVAWPSMIQPFAIPSSLVSAGPIQARCSRNQQHPRASDREAYPARDRLTVSCEPLGGDR